ncbi:hypothetical protein CGCA056_v015119 [Colletotrichum aenigma]|uniref:uncharacterized protein n=1 Tax=Colletotrichum aenigma TaxID=1215731 RepID=UPI001872B7CC|nr:uncharacterized protein CGCA056_v015119 [Colletotrichum aenigma]KAF5483128.1 hypothetical protein CGCA056_v015119 [Colletotrichum aenigma]
MPNSLQRGTLIRNVRRLSRRNPQIMSSCASCREPCQTASPMCPPTPSRSKPSFSSHAGGLRLLCGSCACQRRR